MTQQPKKGLSGFVHTLLRRQPVEKTSDPISRQFNATKSQFIQQQNDFRSVVEETIARLDRRKGTLHAGKDQ